MPEPKITTNIDFPVPLFEWLTAYAEQQGKSRNALVVSLLSQSMDAVKPQEAAQLEPLNRATRPA